jgi:3-deoxy-D-manno-octulosonate 8-phosphate phosphatase KdsC-like HAD superfamily phosphatase
VAVANAVDALKEVVDLVTVHPHGRGVVETIDELLETDFEDTVKVKRELVAPGVAPPPSSREEPTRWGH